MSDPRPGIHGLLAEFASPAQLLAAAQRAHDQGYRLIDAYTPFPIEGLSEALGLRRTSVPLIALIGGLFGGFSGFGMQYWMAAISFPENIGGRPLNSWPAFIPVTFELTVLCASLAAFVGMLALNKLPMPHHPVFNAARFALASKDRFFLCIEAADPNFDRLRTAQFLRGLAPFEVTEVQDD